MIRLERTRKELQGLGEIKATNSELHVFLAHRALWAVAYRA